MSGIQLVQVAKRYGPIDVIPDLSLTVEPGEFMVFLGPSGCGKSTLLRMVAGLEAVSSGAIHIGGRDVTALAPGLRDVAMVFQQYALYPHMTVRDNMAFGLRNVRTPEAEITRRVDDAARMLELQALLERKPTQLSGGQRQRVAIGRAVVKEPAAFLFDEPLSNLDAALRNRTRVELSRLHQRLGATMVFVTHDQVEAMTLATRIVVMNTGRIEQVGTPMEVYRRPASRFVAGFVGSPSMNFLAVERTSADGPFLHVRLPGGVPLATRILAADLGDDTSPLTLGVRAESLTVDDAGILAGRAEVIERLGDRTLVHVSLGLDELVVAEAPPTSDLRAGDNVRLAADVGGVHLFDGRGRAHHPTAA